MIGTTIRKSLALLSRVERRRGALVLIMMIAMAFFETAGIASIMPFLAVLADPSVVETNKFLNQVYKSLGFGSTRAFLVFLGFSFFGLMLVSTSFRTVTHYTMNRFVEMRRHSIGLRLFDTYLRQPYTFFLGRQSYEMTKNILSEVDQLIENVFRPMIRTISFGIVTVFIVTLLLIANTEVAIILLLVMAGLYIMIYSLFRKLLLRLGSERADANMGRFKTAGEALAGIKTVKLLGLERTYLMHFTGASRRLSHHIALHKTISQAPKYLVEMVAMGGILALTLSMLLSTGELEQVLPLIGLYALAGYKLLPALQQLYAGTTQLRFASAALDHIEKDLRQRPALNRLPTEPPATLIPTDSIALSGVSFNYPGTMTPAVSDVTMSIPVGATIGIVGGTGAGKTTVMDLILGLIDPSEGQILIDTLVLDQTNLRAWQNAVGYVPQDIFLTDATVAENIAFGLFPGEINHERVERSARAAQIHDFIVSSLPKGYATMIGERGIRLSGGQRQRLGIARALYHDPPVILFDEATSALDTLTESALMREIARLKAAKTIILIAHRLTTVRNCDCIFLFEKGRLKAQGSYEQLANTSKLFRNMTQQ